MQTICDRTLLFAGSNKIVPLKPIFRFCRYWQNWRRILMMEDGWYLEVEMTPPNSLSEEEWVETSYGNLFWHCTSPITFSTPDRITAELPDEVVASMIGWLGVAPTVNLTTSNLLSQISWEKFLKYKNSSAYRGGGIHLYLVKQGPLVCDQCDDRDNDYCISCGEPNGALRDMLEDEQSEQLDRS